MTNYIFLYVSVKKIYIYDLVYLLYIFFLT
jgi:hypothetical protein